MIAEALFPGYSIANNEISDLGANCIKVMHFMPGGSCVIEQPSAAIFDSSLFLAGVLVVVGAYLLTRASRKKVLPTLLVIAGVGAIGVGLFPENTGLLHIISASIAFVFFGLSAIASYRTITSPLRYISLVLGITTLVSLVLFVSGIELGLGLGGIERMITYPVIIWGMGFGSYLMSSPTTLRVPASTVTS
jgi:hypothetical membrane protein